MDIPELVQGITTFLAPFLPYVLKAGEGAAREAGKEFGADAWERGQSPVDLATLAAAQPADGAESGCAGLRPLQQR